MNWPAYRREREAYARELEVQADLLRREARTVWAELRNMPVPDLDAAYQRSMWDEVADG